MKTIIFSTIIMAIVLRTEISEVSQCMSLLNAHSEVQYSFLDFRKREQFLYKVTKEVESDEKIRLHRSAGYCAVKDDVVYFSKDEDNAIHFINTGETK